MRTCLAALMLILLSAVPCCAEGDAGFWNTMKPDTRMYYIAGWTDGLRNACGRNREGLCRLLDQNMDDVLHMERIVTAIYKQPAYKVLPVGLLISTAAFYLEGVLDGKKAAEYLNRTVTDMAAGSGDGKDGGEKKPKLLTPKSWPASSRTRRDFNLRASFQGRSHVRDPWTFISCNRARSSPSPEVRGAVSRNRKGGRVAWPAGFCPILAEQP